MTTNIAKNNKGLTLFEVMVASFILVIVALPLLSLFANSAKLVQSSYQRTDGTYKAKTLMERLYGLTYPDIVPYGTSAVISADSTFIGSNTGKYYTLSLSPSGPSGVASGTACYFHLIVSSSGGGYFIGPNATGITTLTANDLKNLTFTVSKAGDSYSLAAPGKTINGSKDTNTDPVLLMLNYSPTATIKIVPAMGSDFKLLAYCRADYPTANLTTTVATTLYNNDTPPTSLLLSAVLKTYAKAGSPVENIYQDTFSIPVGSMQ